MSCGGNFGLNQMSFCHLSPNSLSTVAPQHVVAPRLMIKIMMIGQEKQKMAIILPTGQWYAPSAVINDAWYCIVLHGIALYCIVLHRIAWYCMVLHGIAWYCMV